MPPTTSTSTSTSKPTPIPNPRRLLILTPTTHSQSIIPPLLHSLTGTPVTTPPTAPASASPTPTPTLSSASTIAASSTTSLASSTTITTTFAGYTTHPPLHLSNKYYTADVPIWVDEIPLQTPEPTPSASGSTISPAQWKAEFSSPEAQVVRDAIGAVMICFRNPVQMDPVPGQEPHQEDDVEDRADVRGLKEFVRAVGEVRALIEEERGGVGEVPGLVVLVGEKTKTAASGKVGGEGEDEDGLGLEIDEVFSEGWWEDQVCEMGLMGMEVVRWGGKEGEDEEVGRNRYGELQGMRRIKEVLETHDWAATEDAETGLLNDGIDDDLERELLGLDDADNGFDLEVDELQREMVGLRMAIERGGGDGFDDDDDEGDEELRVDAVEALLLRMRAIKDISDELPEAERKRFAAKAVRDIMREM